MQILPLLKSNPKEAPYKYLYDFFYLKRQASYYIYYTDKNPVLQFRKGISMKFIPCVVNTNPKEPGTVYYFSDIHITDPVFSNRYEYITLHRNKGVIVFSGVRNTVLLKVYKDWLSKGLNIPIPERIKKLL